MKTIILIILAICLTGTIKGQDISLRGSGFALSEGENIYTVKSGQLSIGYDLFKKGFNLTPEVDLNLVFNDTTIFAIIPGLKLGHDNFYFTSSYDFTYEIPYYGIGGLIPVTKNGSGISLKIQAGMLNGYAIGYGSFGYTIKIK